MLEPPTSLQGSSQAERGWSFSCYQNGMGLAPTGGSGSAARRCPTARSSLLVMLKSKSSPQPARQEKKVPNLH